MFRMTIDVRRVNGQQSEISEVTFPGGAYSPAQVDHPIDPPPDGAVAAGDLVVLAHHDVDGVAAAGDQVVLLSAHHDVDDVVAAGDQAFLAHHAIDSVLAAGDRVVLAHHDVAEDNADENTIARVLRVE
jgi:hypothetical protein